MPFKAGAEFPSFEEFAAELRRYENRVLANYPIASSVKLKESSTHPIEFVEKFRYQRATLHCKCAGEYINPTNPEKDAWTYKQGCPSRITIALKTKCDVPAYVISILSLNEVHTHPRSAKIYQSLPKQRLEACKKSQIILQKFAHIKTDNKLRRFGASQQKYLVKRKDLYSFTAKKRGKVESNDFETFVEKLGEMRDVTVKLWQNEVQNLQGVFFQDERMRKYFSLHPEIIMFDASYRLNDHMPLIMLLTMDGNGDIQTLGIFILVTENIRVLKFMFEQLKAENPRWTATEVVLTDISMKSLTIVNDEFPAASHQLSIFHVAQIFNREITVKTRHITRQQRTDFIDILNQMMEANNADCYNKLYDRLKQMNCPTVLSYFDENWHNIKEKWVKYSILKHHSFPEQTTWRLELLNQKIEAAITKYSTLPTYFSTLMTSIGTLYIEKAIKSAEVIKKPKKAVEESSSEQYRHTQKQCEMLSTIMTDLPKDLFDIAKTQLQEFVQSIQNRQFTGQVRKISVSSNEPTSTISDRNDVSRAKATPSEQAITPNALRSSVIKAPAFVVSGNNGHADVSPEFTARMSSLQQGLAHYKTSWQQTSIQDPIIDTHSPHHCTTPSVVLQQAPMHNGSNGTQNVTASSNNNTKNLSAGTTRGSQHPAFEKPQTQIKAHPVSTIVIRRATIAEATPSHFEHNMTLSMPSPTELGGVNWLPLKKRACYFSAESPQYSFRE